MEITVEQIIEKLKAGNYIHAVEYNQLLLPVGVEEVYELNDGDISFTYYIYDNDNFSNVDTFVKYKGNWYLLPYYDDSIDKILAFSFYQFNNRSQINDGLYAPFENPRNFGLQKSIAFEEW